MELDSECIAHNGERPIRSVDIQLSGDLVGVEERHSRQFDPHASQLGVDESQVETNVVTDDQAARETLDQVTGDLAKGWGIRDRLQAPCQRSIVWTDQRRPSAVLDARAVNGDHGDFNDAVFVCSDASGLHVHNCEPHIIERSAHRSHRIRARERRLTDGLPDDMTHARNRSPVLQSEDVVVQLLAGTMSDATAAANARSVSVTRPL